MVDFQLDARDTSALSSIKITNSSRTRWYTRGIDGPKLSVFGSAGGVAITSDVPMARVVALLKNNSLCVLVAMSFWLDFPRKDVLPCTPNLVDALWKLDRIVHGSFRNWCLVVDPYVWRFDRRKKQPT